nr:MAG TPA: structural protein [Caudoviricetes sp.]
MPINPIRYPLDLTGTSRDNLVLNELHTLKPTRVRAVALQNGAFYTASIVVRDVATARVLVAGQDYEFDNLYQMASEHAKAEVAAIIVITNTEVSNTISVDYQCIGGLYGYSTTAIMQQIEDLQLDNRKVEWGNIYNKPAVYPPAKHLHDIGDVYGFEYLVQAIQQLRHAIMVGDEGSHENIYRYIEKTIGSTSDRVRELENALRRHIEDKDNPHEVTAGKIGVYTKKEIDDRFGEVIKNGKLVPDAIPLSRVEGNMITLQDDGLYYGTTPPERFANIYVDPDIGVDEEITRFNGRGGRNKPVRTLVFALTQGPGLVNRNIWLAEGKTHYVGKKLLYWRQPTVEDKQQGREWFRSEGETAVFRGGTITIAPYGSYTDNLIAPPNQTKQHNPDIHNRRTTILLQGSYPVFNSSDVRDTSLTFHLDWFSFIAFNETIVKFVGITFETDVFRNEHVRNAARSVNFIEDFYGVFLHPWTSAYTLEFNNARFNTDGLGYISANGSWREIAFVALTDNGNAHKVIVDRQHDINPNMNNGKIFYITNRNTMLFLGDYGSGGNQIPWQWIAANVKGISILNGNYTNMQTNVIPPTLAPYFENGVLRIKGNDANGNWVDRQILTV